MSSKNKKKKQSVGAVPRVLSCVGCRSRKMRCSRSFPCHGCMDKKKECVWEDGMPTKSAEEANLDRLELENSILKRDNERYRDWIIKHYGHDPLYPSANSPPPPLLTSTVGSEVEKDSFGLSPPQHAHHHHSHTVSSDQSYEQPDFPHLVQSSYPAPPPSAPSNTDINSNATEYSPPSPSSTDTSCSNIDDQRSTSSHPSHPQFTQFLGSGGGCDYSEPSIPHDPLPSTSQAPMNPVQANYNFAHDRSYEAGWYYGNFGGTGW